MTSEAVTNAINACKLEDNLTPVTLYAGWSNPHSFRVLIHDEAPGLDNPAWARHVPPGRAAPRPPVSPVGQASLTVGSTPVRAASPYHRALDFGVRASVA